jgi:DNA-binding MarR family transcriptional regulator
MTMRATTHDALALAAPELLGPNDPNWQPLPFPGVVAGVEPSALAAFLAFHGVFNTFTRLVLKDLTQGGTQPSQMECLRVLATEDGLCQRDIAVAMGVSRTRVTGVVQALEQAGYVTRARDRGDQRFARVNLTELGRAIDQEKGLLREAHINAVFGSMHEEERRELTRLLDDLDRRLKARLEAEARTSEDRGERPPPAGGPLEVATGIRPSDGGSKGQRVGIGALDQEVSRHGDS